MNDVLDCLKDEAEKLSGEIKILKGKIRDAPRGRLEIKKNKSRVQYYQVVDQSGLKYIRKSDQDKAVRIAQRDYEEKVLKNLERRYQAIRSFFDLYNSTNTRTQYQKLHVERKKLIQPRDFDLTDDEYALRWQEVQYIGKAFTPSDPEIFTVKKERVRSKSEKIIADTLERKNVPYRYECPLTISGGITVYPDFTILNKRTRKEYFLEHFGMMDNPEYAERAVKRIEEMEQNGIFPGKDLLMTFETRKHPLSTTTLELLIQYFMM